MILLLGRLASKGNLWYEIDCSQDSGQLGSTQLTCSIPSSCSKPLLFTCTYIHDGRHAVPCPLYLLLLYLRNALRSYSAWSPCNLLKATCRYSSSEAALWSRFTIETHIKTFRFSGQFIGMHLPVRLFLSACYLSFLLLIYLVQTQSLLLFLRGVATMWETKLGG